MRFDIRETHHRRKRRLELSASDCKVGCRAPSAASKLTAKAAEPSLTQAAETKTKSTAEGLYQRL